MSKLKISDNLFLEVNELNNMLKFLKEDGYIRLCKSFIKGYGIVKNTNNDGFKVSLKPGTANTVYINPGLAFDSSLEGIVLDSRIELIINNTNSKRWLVLSRNVSNIEKGLININADGSIVGNSTEFTKVLRGQPNFPVKIKFESSINIGEYEVVKVTNDNNALLSGNFTAESNVKYSVIGTFTPGFIPTAENKMIYEYDSYNIKAVDSADRPVVAENEFIIASITFDANNAISIVDERVRYMFNDPYSQNTNSSSPGVDPLVSLLSVNTVGVDVNGAQFEFIFECGYTVLSYEVINNSNSNSINILTGTCNFLQTLDVPDDMFKGWLFLNKGNMRYMKIDSNDNKMLYINNFDSSIFNSGNGDSFVIVPDFRSIEFEITVDDNVDQTTIPFCFKQSVFNNQMRMPVSVYYKDVSPTAFKDIVKFRLRYRLIDDGSGVTYPFQKLQVAQFKNVKGQLETLGDSQLDINITDIQPQEKQRNYS